MIQPPRLLIVAGPTAVGKTSFSISLAQKLDTVILSADSRQVYKGMPIATAQPSMTERQGIKHYLIGHIDPLAPYSAGQFEREAIDLLTDLFQKHSTIILTGGTGLYIRAITQGLDEFPDIDPNIRVSINDAYTNHGLAPLLEELDREDPAYAKIVDRQNHRRVIRALEFIRGTGLPYSSFRKNQPKERFFETTTILLERERPELYDRINQRVHMMVEDGLIEEARKWYPHREFNATQTVGYKELFQYFDGDITQERAIELIQQNSRRYAKRQMTWFRKMPVDTPINLSKGETYEPN